MQKLVMSVFHCFHSNGSVRKVWAYHHANGLLTTRWGAAGAALQENSKPADISLVLKTRREKENKGYVYQGDYPVDDSIDYQSTAVAVKPQPAPVAQPAAAPKKFGNALAHWVIDSGASNVQPEVVERVLAPLVLSGDLSVSTSGKGIVIQAGSASASFRIGVKDRGSVSKGENAWMLILAFVLLAQELPFQLVDDNSNILDRSYLRKNWQIFTSDKERFDAVAEIAGLVLGKAVIADNPAIADFF